jgi:hypothetical protein
MGAFDRAKLRGRSHSRMRAWVFCRFGISRPSGPIPKTWVTYSAEFAQ